MYAAMLYGSSKERWGDTPRFSIILAVRPTEAEAEQYIADHIHEFYPNAVKSNADKWAYDATWRTGQHAAAMVEPVGSANHITEVKRLLKMWGF